MSLNLEKMGPLGLGCASLGNLFHRVSNEDARGIVHAAIEAGIDYMDVAPHYGFGYAERRLGKALREFDPNEQVILSTKVGRRLDPVAPSTDLDQLRQAFLSPEPYESTFDYSYDAVMRSFQTSQERLKRERIDILYVHDLGRYAHGDAHAEVYKTYMNGGYKALRELRDSGVVGAIGLGVNEWQICEEALQDGDYDIFLLAGRYSLLDQSALNSFLPLCKDKNIPVVIGGPYNSGILARGVRKPGPHYYEYQEASPEIVETVSVIQDVCDIYDVPLPAAALQFILAHPQVISVIPGAGRPERVTDSVKLVNHSIPGAFWHELQHRKLVRADAPMPSTI